MANYYIIDQDLVIAERTVVLDALPESLDPLLLIRGQRVLLPSGATRLALRESSGDFQPDMVSYLIPLFSDKLKSVLDGLGVDNVEYSPVELVHPTTGPITTKYWIAVIIGCIECLDVGKSDVTYKEKLKSYKIRSFAIDEAKVGGARMFRLAEKKTLIIINESLKDELAKVGLRGVRILNTREYTGF